MAIDQKTDMMIRRTAMIASVTAAYFLLTADYGPQANALTPIMRSIESIQSSVKRSIFGPGKEAEDNRQGPPQPKEPEEHEKAKLK